MSAEARFDPLEALQEAIARRLGDRYEPRPQQRAMAQAVDRTMAERGALLVEAGTGVGKSFAYLLPAIGRIVNEKEKVVVATHTIALQEQLVERDIPLLQAALPVEFTAALVKGRGNYLSVRRLMLASQRQEQLFADPFERASLEAIEQWAQTTRDGSLATLPVLERPSVWEKVQSDADACMGKACPTYQHCFYQAARRRMLRAQLLVCNHALFFADLALRRQGASLLPEHHHVVLDEAHAAEDVACEHFGLSVTAASARRLLRSLLARGGKRGLLAALRAPIDAVELVDRACHATLAAERAAEAFFAKLQAFVASRAVEGRKDDGPGRAGGASRTVRVRTACELLDAAQREVAEAVEAFRQLANLLRTLKEVQGVAEGDAFELNAAATRAGALAVSLEALAHQKEPDFVYWAQARLDGEKRRPLASGAALRASPVDVGPALREALFSGDRSVTLTSATLAGAGGSFGHIAQRLGLSLTAPDVRTLLLDSPFDYAAQAKLIVDATLPPPGGPQHDEALAQRILRWCVSDGGGAFVLFTSDAQLRRAAARLRKDFLARGLTLLAQGIDGPRSQILERFRTINGAVLFGLMSFWQGVDVPGEALRTVVITKLPFDPPDRPIVEARLERIAAQGGDPFFDESLPRAVLRFKQGFGRLIRSATDRGTVVALDPRIVTKGYGKAFLRALPEGVAVEVVREEEATDIQAAPRRGA